MSDPLRIEAISREVLRALSERRQIAPITLSDSDFGLAEAYAANARICEMRKARGENPLGRKLGFTNRNIWDEYGVYAPIWSYVYDSTVRPSVSGRADFVLGELLEPRIEPELTLGLGRAPDPDMDERALLECVDFVAPGFEIVQSIFPGWQFQAADTIAAFGLHGALILGSRCPITRGDLGAWHELLTNFQVTLWRNGMKADEGHARNVLGGPLAALRNVVRVLADGNEAPIAAGEIVTTGTLTRAFPIQAGEVWRSEFHHVPWCGFELRILPST